MRFGFDLDGVIAKISIPEWLLMGYVKDEKLQETIRSFLHISHELKFHPQEFMHESDEYVIITGREKRFTELTVKWLDSHGINAPIFFCDAGTADMYDSINEFFDALAKTKAEIIKKENVDIFFEDAPDVVEKLRKLCPEVKIIQIGRRIK